MNIFRRRSFKIIAVFFVIFAIIFTACAIYLSDYYKADMGEIEAFMPNKSTEVYKNDYITIGDADAELGFVFYPGGKVEHTAYLPLMRALAARGIFCVLYDMPFNLAVLDVNAAEGIDKEYPEIMEWYAAGHSLGGSMIASYISDSPALYKGLVLLGSYSTSDISGLDIDVLSLYGSEDGVMNREKYEENKSNLPADFTEVVIDGGCHAYFGMYGEQDGDGAASFSAEEQIIFTADTIYEFMTKKDGR